MFVPFSYFSVKTTLGQSLGKLNFCLNFLKEENERNFFCKQLDLKKRVYPSIESTDTSHFWYTITNNNENIPPTPTPN